MKNIHIGKLLKKRWEELDLPLERLCNFFQCKEQDIQEMFDNITLDTLKLLKWSKILEYDFFRIYSHHLILYAPSASLNLRIRSESEKTNLPQFRKNVYSIEIITYLLNLIESKEKTISEVIKDYNIPKTTIYKWQKKYSQK